MNTRRKAGEVREDGFIFRGYQKGAHGYLEQWVSPEVWERRKVYMRAWSAKHRERVKQDPVRLAAANAYAKQHQQRRRAEVPEQYMLVRAKIRAKEKELAFNLTLADIEIPKRCPVFGILLRKATGVPDDASPELDRIDSRKGYVKGNVMVISRKANKMKQNATLAELRRFAQFYATFTGRPKSPKPSA